VLFNFDPATNYKEILYIFLGMSASFNIADLISVQSQHAFDLRITEGKLKILLLITI